MINKLIWDSEFFGLEVGNTSNENTIIDISGYDLIYFFSKENKALETNNYYKNFEETKVVFQKSISQNNALDNKICSVFKTNYQIEDLYELAFESGKHSRFKLDTNFKKNSFELLYKKWVENSIFNGFANEVFLYQENNKTIGFVTIKISENIGNIGLIAVNPSFQGKGIGKKLIDAAEEYLYQNKVRFLNIPTQLENIAACNFYTKAGYQIIEQTNIKHYWKK
jgi:dTDP-4-amino-4,6-dideoxy-D-galactose acyltransferase